MGDRGNIVIRENGQELYLYTHWSGSEVVNIARRALARRRRWDDAPYLARIVFCEMVKGDEDGEIGYGIWPTERDNDHDLVIIDVDCQTVTVGKVEQPIEEFARKV